MNWLSLLPTSSVGAAPGETGHSVGSQVVATLIQTATAVLTTTPTAEPEPPTLTPIVVPTLPPAGQLQSNPLSGDFLTAAAQPPLGPFGIAFALLSLILLGAGLYYYFVVKDRWKRSNPLKYRTTNFWSIIGIVLGVLGLLFVIFRLANLSGLNARFWLYLMTLVILLAGAYAAYFFTQVYPKQLAAVAKRSGPKGGRTPVRARTGAAPTPRTTTPRTGPTATADDALPPPAPPKGNAGNPRGTSPRGERRRTRR